MTAVVLCRRCGESYDPAGPRPMCETGRLCAQAPPVVPPRPDPVDREELSAVVATVVDTPAETVDTPAETVDTPPLVQLEDVEFDPEPPAEEPAKPPKKKPLVRHDWPTYRRRYVEGVNNGTEMTWPTLRDVAEHFDLDLSMVKDRAASEGWRNLRVQWQAQVDATRRNARAAGLAKRGLDLDNAGAGVAQFGLQLVQAKLGEIGQAAQAARSTSGPGGGSGRTIDAMEVQRLAAAADIFHKLGMRAAGDPEVTRLELSGPSGRPIEISTELRRDDPSRLAGVLSVLHQAGLGELFGADGPAPPLEAQCGPDGVYSTD